MNFAALRQPDHLDWVENLITWLRRVPDTEKVIYIKKCKNVIILLYL